MNTTGLTDDEMRVRIAEACGWKIPDHCITKRRMAGMTERQCKGAVSDFGQDKAGVYHDSLPDYPNDLNAMHAAEKSIKCRHTLALYDEYLRREVNPNTDRLAKDWTWEELGRAARATARERALAFLAMLPEPEAGR